MSAMPKIKADCEFCEETVSQLGAYVKVGMRLRHLECHDGKVRESAIAAHEKAKREEAERERRQREDREQQVLIAEVDALGRCPKCGVRVSLAPKESWQKIAEVRELNPTAGRCRQCVAEEVAARREARAPASATPAQAIQSAPTALQTQERPDAKKEEPRDRFSLLDLDD